MLRPHAPKNGNPALTAHCTRPRWRRTGTTDGPNSTTPLGSGPARWTCDVRCAGGGGLCGARPERAVIAGLLDRLADLASPWGYVIVGVLALLEASAMIGLVVPGRGRPAGGRVPGLPGQGRPAGDDGRRRRRGHRRRLHRLRDRQAPRALAAAQPAGPVGRRRAMAAGRGLPGPPRRPGRVLRPVRRCPAGHGADASPACPACPTARSCRGTPSAGWCGRPGSCSWATPPAARTTRSPTWAGRASTVLLILVVLVVAVVMAARAVVRREGAVRTWARTQTERPAVARLLGRFERQLVLRRPAPAAERRLRPVADRSAWPAWPWSAGPSASSCRTSSPARTWPASTAPSTGSSSTTGPRPDHRVQGHGRPGRDGGPDRADHGPRRPGLVADPPAPRPVAAGAGRRRLVGPGGGDQDRRPPPAAAGGRHAGRHAGLRLPVRPGHPVGRLPAHRGLRRLRRPPVVAVEGRRGHGGVEPGRSSSGCPG